MQLIGPYVKTFVVNVTKALNAVLCGFFMVLVNSMVGSSGSLLNLFFIKSPLTKFEIIATKSATQVIAHSIKIAFYSKLTLEGLATGEYYFLTILALITLAGGYIGKAIVKNMTENNFKSYSGYIISIFGILFIGQGIYLLINN